MVSSFIKIGLVKQGPLILLVLASLLATRCSRSCNSAKAHEIRSILSKDSINHRFLPAELSFLQGYFFRASNEFRMLQSNAPTATERTYAMLMEALSLHSMEGFRDSAMHQLPQIRSGPLLPIAYLLEGIKQLTKGDDAYLQLLRARDGFNQYNSLETIQEIITLQQLGYYHRSFTTQIESSSFYFNQALAILNKYEGLDYFKGISLFNLSELSIMFRDNTAALAYVQAASLIALSKEWQGRFLALKGTLCRRSKQFDSSLYYYDLAKAKFNSLGKADRLSEVLREEALQHIIQQDDRSFFNTMGQLGAIDSLKRSRTVNLDRLYGYYYFQKGQPQQSIRHYEKALTTLLKRKPYDAMQPGEAYYLLTEQLRNLQKFEKAEKYCYQSLVFATPLQNLPFKWENIFDPRLDRPNMFVTYGLLADVYMDHFHADKKYQHAEKALQLCVYVDSLILTHVKAREEDAIVNYLPYGHRAFSTGIEACYFLYQHTRDTTYISQAHKFMEKSKSILIYRDLLSRKKEYFPEIPEEFMNREMILKARMISLKQSPYKGNLGAAMSELTAYYSQMERDFPRYFLSKFQLDIPSYQSFQQLSRNKNQSFLQYHTGQHAIYFLSYESPLAFGRIVIDSVFLKQIFTFKQIISRPPKFQKDEGRQFAQLSNYIYTQLVASVGKLKEKLLIIPEGITSQLPFEVLVTDTLNSFQKATYLIHSHQISYAHSLKVFSLPNNQGNTQPLTLKRVLAYGTDAAGKNKLKGDLRQTSEFLTLPASLKNCIVTMRVSSEATKALFLEDIDENYDLIHIALHASSGLLNRYDSRIEFFKNGNNDAFLYANELISKKVKAHTVILANCESSNGTFVIGEGIYSLERAFSQIGASTVVSSAWKLPDQSASEIMQYFYTQLHDRPGETTGCLTLAKRMYLRQADEYLAHPYFWASLMCFENQRGTDLKEYGRGFTFP